MFSLRRCKSKDWHIFELLLQQDAGDKPTPAKWEAQIAAQVQGAVQTGAIAAVASLPPVRAITMIYGAFQFVGHVNSVRAEYVVQADELGLQGSSHAYYTWANTAAHIIGMSGAVEFFSPVDPYADNSISNKALVNGTGLMLIEAGTAAGLGALYSRFTSPCGSWLGGECFMGDTLVHVRDVPGTTRADAAMVGFGHETDENADLTLLAFVAVGIAGFGQLRTGYHWNDVCC